MKESLLKYLRCVSCNTDFELINKKINEEEVIAGALQCKKCGVTYDIIGGVPRFKSSESVVSGFGFEWENIELYKGVDGKTYTKGMKDKDAYREEFENQIYPPVKVDSFKGKVVLDAGCGAGQNAQIIAEAGSKDVIAVDLSNAVDVAQKKAVKHKNFHVVQADLGCLPFKKCFDSVVSVGVIMHTKNPKENFEKLADLLKPSGEISVMLYGKEGNATIHYFVTPIRKAVTSKIPHSLLKPLIWIPTVALYVLFNLGVPLVDKEYVAYAKRFTLKRLYLHVYDHFVAAIANYYTRNEAEAFFDKKIFRRIEITHRFGTSWRCHGVKN